MFRFVPEPPPADESALLERAWNIAGRTLAEVAARRHARVPRRSIRAKGWAGQLIEAELGADSGSRPRPDFDHLGIELKTIPVGVRGHPRESTHVCTVPLADANGLAWETSAVWRKLRRVLWVPVVSPRGAPLGKRLVGSPFLWSPDAGEEAALRADWEELMEMVCLGRAASISAHHGACLQIRPKAANAQALGWGVDEQGVRVPMNPRGFYLRASFTKQILGQHFILPRDAPGVAEDPP